MSKAEERALEHFPNNDNDSLKGRFGFLLGYRQAEKDLELTVDDIMKIDALLIEMWNQSGNKYQEVLKRFKERKEK